MRSFVQVQVVDLDELPQVNPCSTKDLLEASRSVPEETAPKLLGVVLGRQLVWACTGAWRPSPGYGKGDEHFAVDVDACKDRRWRECADVLYGIRPLPLDVALESLESVATQYPGCQLAAVPVDSGGWAVATGPDHYRVVLKLPAGRPDPVRADRSLLPSCLHGWLTAGHSLRELPSVDVTQRWSPAPSMHRTRADRPGTP